MALWNISPFGKIAMSRETMILPAIESASNSVRSASVKSTMYFLFGMVRASWPDPCKFLASVHLI